MNFVVCFLLGDSPASEIYMQTFRNTLFHLHRQGITQKKAYNIQYTAKVWNQEQWTYLDPLNQSTYGRQQTCIQGSGSETGKEEITSKN